MQIRNILVPLDGSRLAEHALPVAATLARQADACIRLVGITPGAGFMEPEDLPATTARMIRDAHERLERYLDGILVTLRRMGRVRVTGEARIDSPVEGILDAVRRRRADLVVMTSHGRGGFARAWLGSVADGILRNAPVPVLVIRAFSDAEADLAGHEAPSGLLVPLDGSAASEAVLPAAAALARAHDVPVTLLRVVTRPYQVPPAVPYGLVVDHAELVRRRTDAHAYLRQMPARLETQDVHVRTAVVEGDSVPEAIAEHAAGHGDVMIAMATHGRGGVRRLLLGSVADKVLRTASQPVLLVRPPEAVGRTKEWRDEEPEPAHRWSMAGTIG